MVLKDGVNLKFHLSSVHAKTSKILGHTVMENNTKINAIQKN